MLNGRLRSSPRHGRISERNRPHLLRSLAITISGVRSIGRDENSMATSDQDATTGDAAPTGRASMVLTALSDRLDGAQSVGLGDLFDRLGPAGFGVAMLILSLPALIPVPGPVGMVLGTCLVLVAVQMLLGLRRLWLPRFLARRQISARLLRSAITRSLPWLRRLERMTKRRRLRPLTRGMARTAIGVPVLLLAVALALPVPLGNVPPVIALVAIALALLEQDGVALLVALGLSAVALMWVGGLILAGAGIADGLWRLAGAA
jgi:hypothetical protein